MTYGSQTWLMKVEDNLRLERTERMMVRHMCGVTLKHRKSSVQLLHSLGIECVLNVMRRGRLRWFGHVERKDDTAWVKACQKIAIAAKEDVVGVRKRGVNVLMRTSGHYS